MKILLKLFFCILIISFSLVRGNPILFASTRGGEVIPILKEIVQLSSTVSNEGSRHRILPAVAIAQTQAGQLTNALNTYYRWIDFGNSSPPSAKADPFAKNFQLLAQVKLLSKLGHAGIQGGHDDWGQERFDQALQFVAMDLQPWNRVAGYRSIIEASLPLGLSVHGPLQRMRGELENWPINELDPIKRFHATDLILDVLEVELLVEDEEGIARALKKAFELVSPSTNKFNTFLLRKVAVIQARLGKHSEARENMKKVYDLRKPFEHIDFDKWGPEARYIWDLCDLAAAQVALGEQTSAQETLSLAYKKMQEYPNHLDIFQMAWQSLAVMAAKLGDRTLRVEAEQNIHTKRSKNSSESEWIVFLVKNGQEDEAIRIVKNSERYNFDTIVEELAKNKRFSTIVKINSKSHNCQREDSCRILSYAIAHEYGLEAAHKWVTQMSNSFLKIYGLLGLWDWVTDKQTTA